MFGLYSQHRSFMCVMRDFSERHAEFVNTNSKVVSLTKQLENLKAELKKTRATIDAGRLNKAEAKSSALSQAEN
ncbi:hypothetical protein Acr_18g0011930 [Actinidia rufa]|uniref:Uncharacterized protein n=1 Tax=Actinidia rufa TaxID=165716 RepID=A0A7J0G8B4_9ERIC|nr:hypothetical protein Acr_18g0011930 [Actinidia rufa]